MTDRPAGADPVPPERRGRSGDGRGAVRSELLAALEVCGLTGLAFTRPVLDSFGRAPETFLARDASSGDVVLFALGVALVPAVVVALAVAATRPAGARVRRWAQVAAVGLLGGVVVWRFGTDLTSLRPLLLAAAAVVGGCLLAVARDRLRATAAYLRFLGVASVVFLLQFLLFSPSSALVFAGSSPVAGGAAAAGDDGEPPPIVVVVLDALPTASLLDGTGHIDRELYPNLSALAGDATWYRNNTTVSAFTYQMVPALLSGRMPETGDVLPDTRAYPDNLFTLFAGTHHIEAVEQITRLCPPDVCGAAEGTAVPTLLGDAVDWWRGGLETQDGEGALLLPGALDPARGSEFTQWVDRQDFSRQSQPGLWFYHLVMPHEPWDLLADGTPYEGVQDAPYGLFLYLWDKVGPDVARQRHVLQTQAVDRMLGELFDRLRAAGTYDESLVVVTADHGQALTAGGALRGVAESQYEQVAWAPMIIKAPHQDEGVIDDSNVWSTDLVPTIADMVGVDLTWDTDGMPAAQAAARRDPADKQIISSEFDTLEPEPGSDFVALDAVEGFERVLATDMVAAGGDEGVWLRGRHDDLVGREVSGLDVAGDEAGQMDVEDLDRIEHPGDGPPMLEVIGYPTVLPPGDVAVAVNGVVATVAPLQTRAFDLPVFHALLKPDAFTAENEVTAYLVEGPQGSETLRPLTVAGA